MAPLTTMSPAGRSTVPRAAALSTPGKPHKPRPRRNSSNSSEGSGRPAEISLLLERRRRTAEGQHVLESVQVLTCDTIRDVQLKLRSMTSWFRPDRHSLILGDRQLLDHEVVGQLTGSDGEQADATGPGFLHIYVRLEDVQELQVNTPTRRLMFGRADSPAAADSPRSALTASLASTPKPPRAKPKVLPSCLRSKGSDSLVLRSQLVDSTAVCLLPDGSSGSPGLDSAAGDAEAVVHLVIQRGTQAGWRQAGDQFELHISANDTLDTIKQRLEAQHGLPVDSHCLLFNGQQLSSSKSLAESGVNDGSVLELVPFEPAGLKHRSPEMPPGSPLLSSPEHELFEGWQKARAGLAKGHRPRLAPAGTGGSYFISDEDGANVAVFKPEDEEPQAANCPKGAGAGEGPKRGLRPGEGAVREVAAFLLDWGHFASVPPTAMVTCEQRTQQPAAHDLGRFLSLGAAKVGSLQAFVRDADGDCEEWGCSQFPVQEVHKIAVLDMRLANTDRNAGNILIKHEGGSFRLTPIDHGACLPGSLSDLSWEWQWWPQASKPFDQSTRDYIASLDADRDLAVLRAHGLVLRPECERVLRTCTALLQAAVPRGLTPEQLANIMCRDDPDIESELERMFACALCGALREVHGWDERDTDGAPPVADVVFMRHMSAQIDTFLDQHCLEALASP